MAKNFKSNVRGADKLFSANDTSETNTSNTENVLNASDIRDTLSVSDTKENQGTSDIQDTTEIRSASNIEDTQQANKKKEYYRFNLKLDMELKEYISEAAWRSRMTVTEYLNRLIERDRDREN